MKRKELRYKKPPVKDGWYRLLNWQDNINYFLNQKKNVMILKWFKRCPGCKSKNLQFVEGDRRFHKWFCKDCVSMHYAFRCPHCNKAMWFFGRLKKHIYREYRLGKYKGNEFFKGVKNDYFEGQIYFHQEALEKWKKYYEEFKKRKIKPEYGI